MFVGKALGEDNKWYFYSRKTQNRVTRNGYWKPLGIEEAVIGRGTAGSNNKKVGTKKYFVFYVGEAPNSGGLKTNWIMHEFHLSDSASTSTSTSSSSRSSKKRPPNKIVSTIHYLYQIYIITWEILL